MNSPISHHIIPNDTRHSSIDHIKLTPVRRMTDRGGFDHSGYFDVFNSDVTMMFAFSGSLCDRVIYRPVRSDEYDIFKILTGEPHNYENSYIKLLFIRDIHVVNMISIDVTMMSPRSFNPYLFDKVTNTDLRIEDIIGMYLL